MIDAGAVSGLVELLIATAILFAVWKYVTLPDTGPGPGPKGP